MIKSYFIRNIVEGLAKFQQTPNFRWAADSHPISYASTATGVDTAKHLLNLFCL